MSNDFRKKKLDHRKVDSTVGKAKVDDFYEMKLKNMPRSIIESYRKLRAAGFIPEKKFHEFVSVTLQEKIREKEELQKIVSLKKSLKGSK